MFCDSCGSQLRDGQGFCHSCGKAIQGTRPMWNAARPRSTENRVARHATTLGVLWIVWSLLHLIPAFGALFIGSIGLPFLHHEVMPAFFIAPMVTAFGGMMAICAILGIAAGWGLLSHQSWARVLLLVMGCLALLNIPIGTALGAYTLWVLLSKDAEQEFHRLADERS